MTVIGMVEQNSIQREVMRVKKKIEDKLCEYGSIELMAQLIFREMRVRSVSDTTNNLRENPALQYLLGLFLTNNNLNASRPSADQINKLIELIDDYFTKFHISCMRLESTHIKFSDRVRLIVQLLKLENDVDPGSYPGQKDEYYRQVLVPLNQHFNSKYGFTIERAQNYTSIITNSIIDEMRHYDIGATNMKDALIIDTNNFCSRHNINDKDMFEKYLNTFSCSFGTQFNDFADPLSNNIIKFKPIIKITDHKFFVSRVELDRRLDELLESLLGEEKQGMPIIWEKFRVLRARYLEKAAYNYLAKIFPNRIFRNAFFTFQNKSYEADLLVIHGDKMFIVESKSGNFPVFIGQSSMRSLKERLIKLVKNVMQQGTNTKNYINSQNIVTFWSDKARTKVLTKINTSKTNYDFFIIGVTLAHMGDLVANLRNIHGFNFFPNDEYPWMVYLYDLDIVVDWLKTPARFIHYLEQRMYLQKHNHFAQSELVLLGYYLRYQNLTPPTVNGRQSDVAYFAPDFMSIFDEYYLRY